MMKQRETSWNSRTLAVRWDDIDAWCGDIEAQREVSGNIGKCGVGVTPQMCNRVTNPWDMDTFSR